MSRAIKFADVKFAGDIPLQCSHISLKQNSKFCPAIAHVAWLKDIQILRKFFDLDEILKLENWKVHPWNSKNVKTSEHTCGKVVEEPVENKSNPESDLKLVALDSQDIGTGEKLQGNFP